MERRVPLALVAALVLTALAPMLSAEAACRPRTASDLGPTISEQLAEPVPPARFAVPAPEEAPATTTSTAASDPATTTTTTATTTTTTTLPDSDPATTTTAPADHTTTTATAPSTPVTAPAAPPTTAPSTPVTTLPRPASCRYTYRMEFPVLGGGQIGSVFGDVRAGGGRWHLGVDIFAPKLTPVVAVRSGTVSSLHDRSGDCCWLALRHDDGWSSLYIHLNNDSFGTDDGNGVGIRRDLQVGSEVRQGELLGWVGDSGNAETAVPHLHFELHTPAGTPIDPGPSLWSSQRRRASAMAEGEPGRPSFDGPFLDDDGHWLEESVARATAMGLSLWCDPWGVRHCPDDQIPLGTALDWVIDMHLAAGPETPASDDVRAAVTGAPPPAGGPVGEEEEAPPPEERVRFALAGLGLPVAPPGEGPPATRGEVAAMILVLRGEADVYDPASALATMHAQGRVDGCTPMGIPLDQPIPRSGLVQMLLRVHGHLPTPPCALIS